MFAAHSDSVHGHSLGADLADEFDDLELDSTSVFTAAAYPEGHVLFNPASQPQVRSPLAPANHALHRPAAASAAINPGKPRLPRAHGPYQHDGHVQDHERGSGRVGPSASVQQPLHPAHVSLTPTHAPSPLGQRSGRSPSPSALARQLEDATTAMQRQQAQITELNQLSDTLRKRVREQEVRGVPQSVLSYRRVP